MKDWIYKNLFLKVVRPAFHRVGLDLVAFCPPVDKRKLFEEIGPVLQKVAAWRPEKAPTPGERTIWQFWWQGADNAPPLVKRCLESVRRHARGWRIVVLDEQNISQYADIPSCIVEKHRRGIISHTHFSDCLRVALLRKYGGVWIDATALLTDDIPDDILTSKMFVFKTSLWASAGDIPDPESFLTTIQTAASGRIGGGESAASSWFLSSYRDSALMTVVAYALEWYWQSAEKLGDYFLFHFLLSYAVSVNKFCRDEFLAMPLRINVKPHMLLFKLLEPFDVLQWRVVRENSFIHKLSYKGNDLCESNGTFLEALETGRLAEE